MLAIRMRKNKRIAPASTTARITFRAEIPPLDGPGPPPASGDEVGEGEITESQVNGGKIGSDVRK